MKVTAYRIAENGYDAMIIGFERPCVISLYKRNVSPLCGSGSSNDNVVFRYSSHVEETIEQQKDKHPKDYTYADGLTSADFYEYYSTIDLSYLTHEQHKVMYTAVAEINDASSYASSMDDDEEQERKNMMSNTDVIKVSLKKCHIKYADGVKKTYNDLH